MSNTIYFLKKILSFTLASAIIVTSVSGCGNSKFSDNSDSSASVDTASVAESISDDLPKTDESEDSKANNTTAPSRDSSNLAHTVSISTNWEDYVGDIDTFVYGLIASEYEKGFDVFQAKITLEDSTEIFGFGYTDYSCLLESDEGESYFPAGFIAYIGEPSIPENVADEGLEVTNLDTKDYVSQYHYVLAYDTDPFLEHCVIWGQYLKYGINDEGSITYTVSKYERGNCDESLGALYSYDAGKYVYDPDVGNAVRITGTSLYELIDYDELEAEVNRILDEQNYNFSKSDVETTVYEAQEALNSYLLSMQEETFMGCSVKELLAISQDLDPMECIRFTEDDMAMVDMSETPPEEPTALAKWLTGACCGTAIAASIAAGIFIPAAAPLSGAISSSAVEVFMEVVVQNQSLSNVNWAKVGVAAASGAMLAWCCPALGSAAMSGTVKALGKTAMNEATIKLLSNIAGYGALTFSNAFISGSTGAAFTYLDGGSDEEAFNAFITGAALGAAFTIGASVLSEGINAGMNALAQNHPNAWLVKASNSANQFIGEHQVHLQNDKIESILAPKSICEARETALNEVKKQRAQKEIFDMFIDKLPSDDPAANPNLVKVDPNTNEPLTKAQLKSDEYNGNCVIRLRDDCSDEVKELFRRAGVTEIKVTNGQIDLSPIADYSFVPSEPMTSSRYKNYEVYKRDLANTWKNPSADIPDDVLQYINENNISRENLVSSDIERIWSDLNLTPHEGADGMVYLVNTEIHGLIHHAGGVAQTAVLEKVKMGTVYFKELARSVASAVTGTLIAEGSES